MKTISFFRFALLGLAISTIGCKKDKDKDPDTFEADRQVAVDGNRADFESDDVSGLVEDIMNNSASTFARTSASNDTSFSYDCATVTVVKKGQNLTGNVTVNFGDGCTGRDGRLRKGISKWTFTDRLKIPNAVIVTTFQDYGVKKPTVEDFVMIDNSSSKTTRNIGAVESSQSMSLKRDIDMKMNLPDGISFTQKGTKNITVTGLSGDRWTRIHTVLAGSQLTGIDRKGRNYTWTATTDIVRKGECAKQGFYKPVSGILTMVNDAKTKVMDFGNGDCDGEVTVSVNGKERRTRW